MAPLWPQFDSPPVQPIIGGRKAQARTSRNPTYQGSIETLGMPPSGLTGSGRQKVDWGRGRGRVRKYDGHRQAKTLGAGGRRRGRLLTFPCWFVHHSSIPSKSALSVLTIQLTPSSSGFRLPSVAMAANLWGLARE